MHKGVKCLDVSTGRVYISRDIVFDETIFPFQSLHPNAGAQLRKEISLLPKNLHSFDHGEENNRFDHLVNSHTTNPVQRQLIPAGNIDEDGADFGQNNDIHAPEINEPALEENDAHGGDPNEDLVGPSTPKRVVDTVMGRRTDVSHTDRPGSSPSGPRISEPTRSASSFGSASSRDRKSVV